MTSDMKLPAGSLEIRNVSRVFESAGSRIEALRDIQIDLPPSSIVSLVGPSGCGKSTLLRMVAGFDRPGAGTITVAGKPVTGPGPDRGVVFQQPQLFPWLSVRDNVVFGPKMRGVDPAAYQPAADRYLKSVGLDEFQRHFPYQLSGGMRQRLQIARVLINEPRILLMDEPFGALDYQTRLAMQTLLLDLCASYKPTVLFITHDIDEAVFISDRIHVMSRRPGRIVETFDVGLPRPRRYEDVAATETFMRLKLATLDLLKGAH
jgi:NitT/TauT family transport system ATP-binding protein